MSENQSIINLLPQSPNSNMLAMSLFESVLKATIDSVLIIPSTLITSSVISSAKSSGVWKTNNSHQIEPSAN